MKGKHSTSLLTEDVQNRVLPEHRQVPHHHVTHQLLQLNTETTYRSEPAHIGRNTSTGTSLCYLHGVDDCYDHVEQLAASQGFIWELSREFQSDWDLTLRERSETA